MRAITARIEAAGAGQSEWLFLRPGSDERQGLLAKKFVEQVTWAAESAPTGVHSFCRRANWYVRKTRPTGAPPPYSPVTRLYYLMALEKCTVRLLPGNWNKEHPVEKPGKSIYARSTLRPGGWSGRFHKSGRRMARNGRRFSHGGRDSVLRRPQRRFRGRRRARRKGPLALPDQRNYQKSSPMTYTVHGKQFVALAAGPSIVSFACPKEVGRRS